MTQKVEYLLPNERMSSIHLIRSFCADAGYRGTFISDLKEQLDLDIDISEKINAPSVGKTSLAMGGGAHPLLAQSFQMPQQRL